MKKTIIQYNAPIHGNPIGEVSGQHAVGNYTHQDLAIIKDLIRDMVARHSELPFTDPQRQDFENQLKTVHEQVAALTPQHSLPREALHTLRHILETVAGHALAGHWLQVLHTLG